MSSPDCCWGHERIYAPNAVLYEHMAGLDLSVQNEHLRIATENQPEERKYGSHDPFGVFLGAWAADAKTETIKRCAPPTNPVPELPVEIWSAIIDLATHIPGAYDIHDYSSIAAFTFDNRGICARFRFETAMQDKLAISSVCKRLNAICQPFLFKHLRIESGTHAQAILDMLRKAVDIGKSTVRIDLALEGNHAWNKSHTNAMVSIFRHCPNLVSFSTSLCDPGPRWTYSLPSLIEALADHKHFRRIEVMAEKDVLRSIESFLKDLEVLWLLPGHIPLPVPLNVKGRQLRALIVSDYTAEVRNLEAPELRACIIQKNDICIIPSIRPRKIEYLAVLDIQSMISTLNTWTSLRTLSIKYAELATRKIHWPRGLQHPTLECIVIEDLSYDFLNAASVEHLQENLLSIIEPDIFPHVCCIRVHLSFFEDKLPEPEANIRWEWLRCCLERGVRVEMLQGNMERTGNQWKFLSCNRKDDIL